MLTPNEAIAVLQNRSGLTDEAGARTLAEALGRLHSRLIMPVLIAGSPERRSIATRNVCRS